MKKLLLITVSLLLLSAGLYAQEVSGVVTDEQGNPLPGVNVVVRQTQEGTITDVDGHYRIRVPGPEATLSFTFVGYQVKTVEVGSRTQIDINLELSVEALDEVVVVGYGTMKKRDLTGSVASVSADDLKDIPVTSVAQAITGRLAGVQITTAEGSPDAEVRIRVRGGGSITQDNSPLFIIDGFPADDLGSVAPSDIESIDVLKDASSTAIYGARGANGVVIVTTKSGSSGKTRITYNAYYGKKRLSKKLDVLNPYEFVHSQYERLRGSFQDRNSFIRMFGEYDMIDELYLGYPGTDWQEEVFGRDASSMYHNLGIEGGNDKTRFNLSLTNNTDEGIMIESGYTRNNLSFRFDQQLSERLDLNFDVKIADTRVTGAGTSDPGTSTNNRLKHSVIYMPTTGLTEFFDDIETEITDDEYYEFTNLTDPVLLARDEYRLKHRTDYSFNGALNYRLADGLIFRSEAGYKARVEKRESYDGLSTPNARKYGDKPIAEVEDRLGKTFRIANTLNFERREIGNLHTINLLIGQEMIMSVTDNITILSRGFPVGITPYLALGSMGLGEDNQKPDTEYNESRLLSFFGRANYNFGNRFLTSITVRADGSSKFGPENRWGIFPSFSGGWRISEEEFMENVSFISFLKLRGSYGQAGNDRIDDQLWRTTYKVGTDKAFYLNEEPLSFFYPDNSNLANPFLKWETMITRNIGLDLGFFKNRLLANIDVYKNTGMDLLVRSTVPPETGYLYQMTNIGQTTNKGLEIILNGSIIEQTNFNLSASFNISFNRNNIDHLGEQDFFLESSGWNNDVGADYIVMVGQPVGMMYGFVTDGYYTVSDFTWDPDLEEYILNEGIADNSGILFAGFGPGSVRFADLADPIDPDGVIVPDGNKVTFEDDRVIIGNSNPKHIGGFNIQAAFWRFDASVFLNWVYGNDIYNANKIEFTSQYRKYTNLLSVMSMEQRYRYINDEGVDVYGDPDALAALNSEASIWAPPQGRYLFHSWAVEDGSFLRVNNITIGYTLPGTLTKRISIERLRIYATGNNLFTFTNYSGFDPEVNTRRSTPLTPGVDYSAYPRSRALLVGINVTL